MKKVIASIENNPYKSDVRKAIIAQAVEWGRKVKAATLPAKSWKFETALLEALPKTSIQGFEMDKETHDESKKNKPDNSNVTLTHGKFSLLDPKTVNFAWFDFCGTPYGGNKWGFSRIDETAAFIRSKAEAKENALCYVTFCMTSRFMSIDKMRKKLWGGNLSIEGATKRKLWSAIGIREGEGVHLVFEVTYLGGEKEKTPMLTLGFQIGKQTITPFKADFKAPVLEKRAEVHAQKYGGDYISPEQEKMIEQMAAEAKNELEPLLSTVKRLEEELHEARKKLDKSVSIDNLHRLDDKQLIMLAHKKGLPPVAIHKLTTIIPYESGGGHTFWGFLHARNLSRRNVGATIAHLHR